MNASRTWVPVCVVVVGLLAGKASADTFGTGANEFDIDFVPISGDAGDLGSWPADSDYTFIGVNRGDYRMGKCEITNDQWNKFKAELGVPVTGDPVSAYDYDPYWTGTNVPTNEVSWYEAAQFVNWLNTSTGHQAAYKFTGTQGASDYTLAIWDQAEAFGGTNLYRHKDAFYFLPTEDEWVKAAYWNGTSLQTYATKPGDTLHQGDGVSGTGWNYYDGGYATDPFGPWDVGSGSEELNGTFDMMGNVYEWMESPYSSGDYRTTGGRRLRGGSFVNYDFYLAFFYRSSDIPNAEGHHIGFRVASAPEPAPPVIVAASSVKTHEAAGDWGIDLSLTGDGVECRTGGPTQLVITFDQDVYGSGSLSDVWLSAGTVDGVTIAGNTVTVDLSGALNAMVLTVAFPGIENIEGQLCDDTLCIRVLAGDVNGDGEVSIFDLVTVRDNTGLPVTEANCRGDVNGDGEINIFDLVLVRDQTGTMVSFGGMALIPAGEFEMGDTFEEGSVVELPVHAAYVDAFYMDRYEVTKCLWDTVRAWGVSDGYTDLATGGGKAAHHSVHIVNWYDCVKWSNARSEMEGRTPCYYTDSGLTTVYKTGEITPYVNWAANGYRLPTEAEWEKGARGGASGHRFPWSDTDTIQHARANYYSDSSYSYDTSPTRGFHPDFDDGVHPYTSPVGYFAPNGYGLYDMAGNLFEWCNDWYSGAYYSSSPYSNPHGTTSGEYRVLRGGGWVYFASDCRVARRYNYSPDGRQPTFGFRLALDSP